MFIQLCYHAYSLDHRADMFIGDYYFVYGVYSLFGGFTLFTVQSLDNKGLNGKVINDLNIIWTYRVMGIMKIGM